MSRKRKVLQGSASNLVRMLLATLAALVLPPFLVRRMSPAEYGAWVLILQLSAYVNLLDFGLQTAIGKFVAEYDATGDRVAAHRVVSTSFSMLTAAAIIGSAIIGVMTWYAPQLFHQMPPALVHEVRLGLLAVGLSSAIALPFSVFPAIFTGLQQYAIPTVIGGVSRIASAAGLIVLLLLRGDLVQLALALAAFNLLTAAGQFVGWERYASQRVGFSFLSFDRGSAVRLARYGGSLSVWTLAGLLISGLDVLIVGHYDLKNVGYYGIASTATNFMLVVISSFFGPLLPAVSAMQSGSTPIHIGELSIRVTRYCALLLSLIGLPMLFGAYPLLRMWVGRDYALRSTLFLEVLVLGNMVRELGYPYSLVVVATGKQHLAMASAVAEAAVNVVISIWLVQRVGAVGVAVGTLVGAFVSIGVHLAISMRLTQPAIHIRRSRFVLEGLLRPLLSILPSLLLYPFWRRFNMLPFQPLLLGAWFVATAAILWKIGLTGEEQRQLLGASSRLLYWRSERV